MEFSWIAFLMLSQTVELPVAVYNYAGVAEETLAEAKGHAAKALARAEVQTRWIDPSLLGEDTWLEPSALVVNLLPETMGKRLPVDKNCFGFAYRANSEAPAFVAGVLYDRVRKLAESQPALLARVLGHVIAHELGHLVLGHGRHSASGLMKIPWQRKELEWMEQGTLSFSSQDAHSLRWRAAARLASAGPRRGK